jgi:beta-barrel assembly-enhancing protease
MHSNPYHFQTGASPPPPPGTPAQTVWAGGITDGQSASSWPVNVALLPDGLALTRPGAERPSAVWAYADVSVAEPVRADSTDVLITSQSARRMTLYVKDARFAQLLAARAPQTTLRATRFAGIKAGAPVGAVAFALMTLIYGFDLAPTKAVARLMPEAARERLGRNVLASLPLSASDKRICDDPAGRAAVDALAKRLMPDVKDPARKVLVLNWSLVNAFAVPGGQVILTRGIIEKASGPDEIAGVLAHEIGHGLELHAEAGLVRAVGFWALIQMVFTGTPGALGNIGSSLVQLAHNRSFEREADAVALKMLRDAKISPKAFAGFFRRMDGNRPEKPESSRRPFGLPNDVFDTHPSSPERIRTIESQADYAATPALTNEQWQALRTICRTSAPATPPPPTGPIATPTFDEQIQSATLRIARAPTADNYWFRGEAYLQAKRFAEAILDFDKALALAPDNSNYLFSRGNAKTGARNFDAAIADYASSIRLNPRFTAAFAGRANAFREMGDTAAALRDYDAALAINPRYVAALFGRGLVHSDMQRWTMAEADFTKAIDNNKAYAFAYVRRAEAREKLGQRDKAIEDFREGLRAAPSSVGAEEAFRIARARLRELGFPER